MTLYVKTESIDFKELSQFPLVLIHGGAGPQDPKGPAAQLAKDAIQQICENIKNQKNWKVPNYYEKPGSLQLDVESPAARLALQSACYLEAEPQFNAGFGAALQADGIPRVSASFMESQRLKFSAVMNVSGIKHPCLLAHYLQSERFPVLDSVGTESLATSLHFPREDLVVEKRYKNWKEQKEKEKEGVKETGKTSTIGAVVVDEKGNLACITSTGGVGNETVGRVGDTPTVAGNYCTSRVAVSCTGYGEQILNQATAVKVATRVEDGFTLEKAVIKTLEEAAAKNYELAFIAVSVDLIHKKVHSCLGSTSEYFIWGSVQDKKIETF